MVRCAMRKRSLLFMPLSSHPQGRAYQLDLLGQMERKQLRGWKVLAGADVPAHTAGEGDLAITMLGLGQLADEWLAIASVVGPLLSFRCCRTERLRPDEPSVDQAITRLVGEFPLHGWRSGGLG